jgi:hypothetical protein
LIAALYVETDGTYYGLPDVEPWDEARDARLYDGPWPVVAHPPCAAWSSYAASREACFGLPAGEDGGCFASALAAVQRFGGVLEHPARSKAWRAFNLPRPQRRQGWSKTLLGEWVAEVDQAAYGHRLHKPTWLYYVGAEPPAPILQEIPRDGLRTVDGVTSSWRNPTSPAFRDYLLALADDPTRLAIEGRALPYMGRRRLDQGAELAR